MINRIRFLACILVLMLVSGCSERKPAGGSDSDFEIASTPANSPVTVVFIHGVLGSAIQTFGRDAAHNWPAMLAHDSSLSIRPNVLSIGYASHPIGAASNINEIANRLLSRLIDKGVFEERRKVIFIAHSMGGLITKRLLVQLRSQAPEAYKQVAAVFFLATPSGGSDLAQVAAWMSGNPQFGDMKPSDVNTLLQVYEEDWAALLRQRSRESPYPKAYCAYETLPTGRFHVVPRSRAQSGCDETPIAFDRDHLGIVKPDSTQDEVYRFVLARLKRVMADEFVQLHIKAVLTDRYGQALASGQALHSGEQFALRVEANRPTWFYVVSVDPSGKQERLFPSQHGGKQSAPQSVIRMPEANEQMLQLDDTAGMERLYVFANSAHVVNIETLQREVQAAKPAHVSALLDTALQKRGVVIAKAKENAADDKPDLIEPSPPQVTGASTGSEAALVIHIAHL